MELITTHIGADFDALASVVAAKKLYPGAKAVLPGSPEKSVRVFLSLWKDEIGLDNERDIDFAAVKKLIIVETRLASRIGKAKEALKKKDVKIEIYDHHPRTRYDIRAGKDIFKPTGATVTMLLDLLRKKKIPISPLEATIMAMGIYEDTGSLTFQITTKLDIDMVGYLFSHGASLNTVSSYLKRELTPLQLEYLSALIKKTRDYLINGVHVGVTAVESPGYIEDFALLVQKLIDIENFNVIFAFAKSGSKIHMVARSHLPYVKVDKIAESFGGGGHHYAAGAVIKDIELDEALTKLLKLLKTRIKPKIFAADSMRPLTKTASVSMTIKGIKSLMKIYNLDCLALFENNRMAGIITRLDVERAIKKGYSHSKAKGYMKTKFARVNPRTPLYKVEQLMAKDNIGHISVFKNKKLLGIIGRLDIAKVIYRELIGKKGIIRRKVKTRTSAKSVAAKMEKSLPDHVFKILKLAGAIAAQKGYRAFAVGGFVRDIILGVKNFDVDIVLEGDGIAFSHELAKRLNGSLVLHKRFGTATVVTNIGVVEKRGPASRKERFKIDIATARKEYYEYPAALPRVSFSSIKQDLYRRDFTINAMAVSLNKGSFGRLIDFFNGQSDLRARKIRVLHDLSFVEDPTRIFRAVRFEQRYNFMIEAHTENLIKTAVSLDMFGRTQKQRLRDELILILSEDTPAGAVIRMDELHELRFIHPRLKLAKVMLGLFDAIDEARSWYESSFPKRRPLDNWIIYFMAMTEGLNLAQIKNLCGKFVFTKGDEKRLISCKRQARGIIENLEGKKDLSPSQIYRHLEPISYEVIIFIMAKVKMRVARERISLFFKRYNGLRISIGGRDLKELGMAPCPGYKKILNKILYEKLDGRISGRDEELGLAKKFVGLPIGKTGRELL